MGFWYVRQNGRNSVNLQSGYALLTIHRVAVEHTVIIAVTTKAFLKFCSYSPNIPHRFSECLNPIGVSNVEWKDDNAL